MDCDVHRGRGHPYVKISQMILVVAGGSGPAYRPLASHAPIANGRCSRSQPGRHRYRAMASVPNKMYERIFDCCGSCCKESGRQKSPVGSPAKPR